MRSLSSFHKKGQVGNLAPAILSLVFAAVVLVFGLVINQSLRDVDSIKVSKSITNETRGGALGIGMNSSGYTLASEQGEKTNGFSITEVWASNTTGYPYNLSVPAANYTVDSNTGNFSNATAPAENNVTVSYGYLDGDEAWDASNDTLTGLGSFADFWEIIVLAIVITVVIGLLLAVFGGGGRRAR